MPLTFIAGLILLRRRRPQRPRRRAADGISGWTGEQAPAVSRPHQLSLELLQAPAAKAARKRCSLREIRFPCKENSPAPTVHAARGSIESSRGPLNPRELSRRFRTVRPRLKGGVPAEAGGGVPGRRIREPQLMAPGFVLLSGGSKWLRHCPACFRARRRHF